MKWMRLCSAVVATFGLATAAQADMYDLFHGWNHDGCAKGCGCAQRLSALLLQTGNRASPAARPFTATNGNVPARNRPCCSRCCEAPKCCAPAPAACCAPAPCARGSALLPGSGCRSGLLCSGSVRCGSPLLPGVRLAAPACCAAPAALCSGSSLLPRLRRPAVAPAAVLPLRRCCEAPKCCPAPATCGCPAPCAAPRCCEAPKCCPAPASCGCPAPSSHCCPAPATCCAPATCAEVLCSGSGQLLRAGRSGLQHVQ